jgi:hypothetical protein
MNSASLAQPWYQIQQPACAAAKVSPPPRSSPYMPPVCPSFMPQGSDLFLEGPAVNRDRLLELLQFVLAHFTTGGGAKRLNDLLQPAGAAAAPGSRTDASSSSGSRQQASTSTASSAPAAADGSSGAANGAANGSSTAASDVSTGSTGSSRAGAPAAGPVSTTPAAGGAPTAAGGSSHRALAPVAAAAGAAPAAPPAAQQPPAAAAAGGRRERSGTDPSSRLVRDLLSARIEKASILAPIVGMLLGLQEAGDDGLDAALVKAGAAASSSGAGSSSSSSDRPRHVGSVLGQLAQEADERLMERMQFLQVGAGWWALKTCKGPAAAPEVVRQTGEVPLCPASARAVT